MVRKRRKEEEKAPTDLFWRSAEVGGRSVGTF
jgi:hypothetical protein